MAAARALPAPCYVTVLCDLCGQRLHANPARAWYTAMDHAVDTHREQLLATPETVYDWLHVAHHPSARRPSHT